MAEGGEPLHPELVTLDISDGKDTGKPSNSNVLSIVTMNMGGPPKLGVSQLRRDHVAEYLNATKPDIVFSQEIRSPKSKTWKLDDVKENYVFMSSEKQAGIAYNSDKIEEVINIDKIEKDKIDPGFADKERLCAAVLLDKNTHFRLLVVSWHGPINMKATKALPPSERYLPVATKQERFDALLQFVERMGNHQRKDIRYKHDAIFIGGDFNLSADKTEGHRKGFQLASPGKTIDYFMYKLLVVECKSRVKWVLHGPMVADIRRVGYLDHEPVRVEFHPLITMNMGAIGPEISTMSEAEAPETFVKTPEQVEDNSREPTSDYLKEVKSAIVFPQKIGAAFPSSNTQQDVKDCRFINNSNCTGFAYNQTVVTLEETVDADELCGAIICYKGVRVLCMAMQGEDKAALMKMEEIKQKLEELRLIAKTMQRFYSTHKYPINTTFIAGTFKGDPNKTESRLADFQRLSTGNCTDIFFYDIEEGPATAAFGTLGTTPLVIADVNVTPQTMSESDGNASVGDKPLTLKMVSMDLSKRVSPEDAGGDRVIIDRPDILFTQMRNMSNPLPTEVQGIEHYQNAAGSRSGIHYTQDTFDLKVVAFSGRLSIVILQHQSFQLLRLLCVSCYDQDDANTTERLTILTEDLGVMEQFYNRPTIGKHSITATVIAGRFNVQSSQVNGQVIGEYRLSSPTEDSKHYFLHKGFLSGQVRHGNPLRDLENRPVLASFTIRDPQQLHTAEPDTSTCVGYTFCDRSDV